MTPTEERALIGVEIHPDLIKVITDMSKKVGRSFDQVAGDLLITGLECQRQHKK